MAIASSKSSFLFVLFLCLVGSVSSLAIRETNAHRMARGLSPLSPLNLRRGSGTETAKRSVASPAPPTTAGGRLQVRKQAGDSILGHVSNTAPISGLDLSSQDDGHLHVSITYSPSSPEQLDILATDPKFPAPYYVGAVGGLNKYQSTSGEKLTFFNVGQTQPGSIPAKVGDSQSHVESAIWKFDPSSKKLKATWINADGSEFVPVLVYASASNELFWVGEVEEWKNKNPSADITPIDLLLV